ncbi:MAG: HIT domain-containing protein [Candidatus Omnitrophica bacterium]|nr:HIT domain-containing protein [Candidatus Omnitrophota bacterium]
MDKLWAPWRVPYITKIVKQTKGSVFSKIFKEKNDKKNYIFILTKYSFSVLNLYPYNNGHVLVLPKRQVKDLSDLRREERDDLMDLLEETKSLLDEVLKPAGYNIGINIGRIAGAGFPQHLHIHIVPRWKGDANFMPVVANTKVISQSLDTLYQKLVDAYKKRHRRTRR